MNSGSRTGYKLFTASFAAAAFIAVPARAGCPGGACSAVSKPAALEEAVPAVKPQAACPVMGGKIDKKLYADVAGRRIYVCCNGCIARIKAAPAKYLKVIKARGETAEPLLCTKCGQVKGSKACCKPGVAKCAKCDLAKGSPGCCKIPAGVKQATLCVKCGQVKGTAACCSREAAKCAKCGWSAGSPGCCKAP